MTASFDAARAARAHGDGRVRIRSRAVHLSTTVLLLAGGAGVALTLRSVLADGVAGARSGVTPLLLLVAGLLLRRCVVLVGRDEVEVVGVTGHRRVARGEVVGVDTAATGSVLLRVRLHLRDGTIVPMTATGAVPRSGARIGPRSAGRDLEAAFRAWSRPPDPAPTAAGVAVPGRPVGAPVPGVRPAGPGRVRLRSDLLRLLAVLLGVVGVLPALRFALIDPSSALRPPGLPVAIVLAVVAAGLWRSHVDVTADEVTAVNLWRTHRAAREQVVDVVWAKTIVRGNVLRLVRADGGSVPLAATLSISRTVTAHRSQQAEVEAALHRWRATGELPTPGTA